MTIHQGSPGRHDGGSLLCADDPPPFALLNPQARSPFLLIGDHAGNSVPSMLNGLGLPAGEPARHIGWDIGVRALGVALAARLDAVFLHQTYSRLVIDCNRDPGSAEAIPEISDGTTIPGNRALSAADRAARIAELHAPYQQAIAEEIVRRAATAQETVLVSLHSFTPVFGGIARPWDAGILHDGANDGFARRLLALLSARDDLVVADNAPYRMDATDHTVPRHAFAAGLPYAEIEIRQDRLAADVGRWVEILAAALEGARSP
jgi:predicted N-formylglutamate amidohydrolase